MSARVTQQARGRGRQRETGGRVDGTGRRPADPTTRRLGATSQRPGPPRPCERKRGGRLSPTDPRGHRRSRPGPPGPSSRPPQSVPGNPAPPVLV